MTIEEIIEQLSYITLNGTVYAEDYKAIRKAMKKLKAIDDVKAEIASLKGDNFPNSYYIKIIDKHLQEVTTDE